MFTFRMLLSLFVILTLFFLYYTDYVCSQNITADLTFKKDIILYKNQNTLPTGYSNTQKSKTKAWLFSLLIPGMGELYLKDWNYRNWGSGRYFFTAEILSWSTHFYLKSYSSWINHDAKNMAAQYAGVNWKTSKPFKFKTMIGKFDDIYAYNESQRRLTGRSLLYEENPDNYWKWDSESHRKKYDRLRAKSNTSELYAKYTLFGVFVNHVLSSVNSLRIYRNEQKNREARLQIFYVNQIREYKDFHGLCLLFSGI